MTGNPFDRVGDAIRRVADTARPLTLCEVIDTAAWSASGPALQCVRMGPGQGAEYLCLPLPQGCAGILYASLRGVGANAGERIIGRLDLTTMTWTKMSDHPAGGGSA